MIIEEDEDAVYDESESDDDEGEDDEEMYDAGVELRELAEEAKMVLKDIVCTHDQMMEAMDEEEDDDEDSKSPSTQKLVVPHYDHVGFSVTPNSPYLVGAFKVAGGGYGYCDDFRIGGSADRSDRSDSGCLGAAVVNTGDTIFGSHIDLSHDLCTDMEEIGCFNTVDIVGFDSTGRYIHLCCDNEDWYVHMLVDTNTCSTVRSVLSTNEENTHSWTFLSDGSCIGYTGSWRANYADDVDDDELCPCMYRFFPGTRGVIKNDFCVGGCKIRDDESTTVWSSVGDVSSSLGRGPNIVLSSQDCSDPAAVFCVLVEENTDPYDHLHDQTLALLPASTAPEASRGGGPGFHELRIYSVADGSMLRKGYFASESVKGASDEWCLSADLQQVIIWNEKGITLQPAFHETINKQFLSAPDSKHFLVGPWTPKTIVSSAEPLKVFREHSIFISKGYAVLNLMTGEHLFQLPLTGEETHEWVGGRRSSFRLECTSNAILMFYKSGSIVRVPFGGTPDSAAAGI